MRENTDQINSECERFSHSDSFRIHNSYYSSQKSYFLPSFSFEKNIILSLMLLPLSPTIVTNLLLNLMRSKSKFLSPFVGDELLHVSSKLSQKLSSTKTRNYLRTSRFKNLLLVIFSI